MGETFKLQLQDAPHPAPAPISGFDGIAGTQGALSIDVPVVTKTRNGTKVEQPSLLAETVEG